MPTYLTLEQLQTSLGGEDNLKLIADPTFTNSNVDEDIVNEAIEYAEGELLRYARAAPDVSGLSTWVENAAQLPTTARNIIVSLAKHRIHEVVRATVGFKIPPEVVKEKDNAMSSLFNLTADGSVAWVAGVTPAAALTQQVRVYTDESAKGRRARSAQVRKLIG